jgi:TPR repeat protein
MQHSDNYNRLLGAYDDMSAGRYDVAHEKFEQLASVGEEKALLYLGWMYEQGLGCSVDEKQADVYYKKLCDMGDDSACYHSASLKFRHNDIPGALALFERAAESGHPSAAYWASAIYSGEGGYIQDSERATYYLEIAANLGHAFAKRDIAKKRVHEADQVYSKVIAVFQYLWCLLKGIAVIGKDADDLRVR